MRLFPSKYRLLVWFVVFLVILFILYSWRKKASGTQQKSDLKDRGLFKFDSKTREIRVRNLEGKVILEGSLGVTLDGIYSSPEEFTKNGLHYTWGDHVILSITKGLKNCLLVDWDVISDDPFSPMDCFSLGKSVWYGGGQLNVPAWPINKASVELAPFYAHRHSGVAKKEQHYTSVLEPYWLSSAGVVIHVDDTVPLHVSINANGDKKLCLKADAKGYPHHRVSTHLKYKLCFGSNVKSTHTVMSSQFFEKPTETFATVLLHHPVCGFKSLQQKKLERLFRGILVRQFDCGHIDLGFHHNLQFGKQDFYSPTLLISQIQQKKMKVMATIGYEFSTNSREYSEIPKGFLVKHKDSNILDLARNNVGSWFLDKVEEFRNKYKLDSVRFCCGQISFPVGDYGLSEGQNPGIIVRNYAKIAAKVSKNSDIEVGYKTQSLPLVIRIADRNPEWGREMGLRSLIPMVLSIGISGYPFVTIGPIGGVTLHEGTRPEKELYLRWMQISMFFPVMEFKIYPWEYDDETTQISAELLETRSSLMQNILDIARQSVTSGFPIIRPMWWIAPNDPRTYTLDTQFMLGDIYLVAPVLWSKKSKHDAYLPKGVWREMFGKGMKYEIEVGRWVSVHNVDVKTVVYFECLLCKS